MKLAFIGFRHGHIMGLYDAAMQHPQVQVVAACEEDAASAEALNKAGKIKITHGDAAKMLEQVECDAVAIGDYYSKRGPLAIEALKRGKHVIADKPLCIGLDELEQIKRLSQQKKRAVGCMLDMRCGGAAQTVRRLIREGAIGEVITINFTAQHPLLYGSRPMWYFEEGKHGGTINDIGIHAFDALPWITGRRFKSVVAARGWNARLPQHPFFQDCGQMMLQLDNGGGVLGDVSYLAPDGCGYSAPQYWRMSFHGSDGVVECAGDRSPVLLARNSDKVFQQITPDKGTPNSILESFLRETSGQGGELSPSTADVLEAMRVSLTVQNAADTSRRDVVL